MIDLHTHTIWSDGILTPAEMVQQARAKGSTGLALTDHVDESNLEAVVAALVKFCAGLTGLVPFPVLPGFEITHVPPAQISRIVKRGRELGAKLVVMHGETVVEPVPKGSNRAAILAGVDVLAHPGLITEAEVKLAARRGVALEISARQGHSLANGHVARLAKKFGAALVLDTDAHAPADLITRDFALIVAQAAGLAPADFRRMQANSRRLLTRPQPPSR
jgi:histidinol phosphatase-like PHP family hydrolase